MFIQTNIFLIFHYFISHNNFSPSPQHHEHAYEVSRLSKRRIIQTYKYIIHTYICTPTALTLNSYCMLQHTAYNMLDARSSQSVSQFCQLVKSFLSWLCQHAVALWLFYKHFLSLPKFYLIFLLVFIYVFAFEVAERLRGRKFKLFIYLQFSWTFRGFISIGQRLPNVQLYDHLEWGKLYLVTASLYANRVGYYYIGYLEVNGSWSPISTIFSFTPNLQMLSVTFLSI